MTRFAAFSLRSLTLALAASLLFPAGAAAQFSDSYNFLKAVRERDGNQATKLLNDETTRVINTRDSSSGETALAIVVKNRDLTWTRFLLAKGANPGIGDKEGVTPLMHATLLGFAEGAEALLGRGAAVDQNNSRGETALILAVQRRDAAMVRMLIKRGANPDKADHIAGLSARDYAKRDDRTGTMLALLDAKDETAKPLGPVFGPN
ncbi:MAG: ankyrin repeat domain-containing protein [Sphingopyxis sp.]|nr:ankyrin repeat domain-containing protein [Sphingopyxis sp.]